MWMPACFRTHLTSNYTCKVLHKHGNRIPNNPPRHQSEIPAPVLAPQATETELDRGEVFNCNLGCDVQ
jgi:hypothetical protein